MPTLELIIGDKRLSSWSLRPWLALKRTGLPFKETLLQLGSPAFFDSLQGRSPTMKVPLLVSDGTPIWESLAICEHIAELAPQAKLWPEDRAARAYARAVSCEMHVAFAALRRECSMNILETIPGLALSEEAARDVARVETIWSECRSRFGRDGRFLFGSFTIADAMFAPVASRFRTYGLATSDTSRAYVDTIFSMPETQAWLDAAKLETVNPERVERYRGFSSPSPRLAAQILADAWIREWNSRDLNAILAHYSDEVELVSPKALALTGGARVVGKDALRVYWSRALEHISALEFKLEEMTWDDLTKRLWLRYVSTIDGKTVRAAEVMEIDAHGKIARSEALYGT